MFAGTKEDLALKIRQAAASGDVERIMEIMDASRGSVDINAGGSVTKKTALHQAVIHNNIDVVAYLIKLPELKLTVDNEGKTPLDYAITGNKGILRLLVRRFPGVPVECDLVFPPTDLVYSKGLDAFQRLRAQLLASGREAKGIMALAREYGCSPDVEYHGHSFLHLVILHTHNLDAVGKLLEAGYDPNQAIQPANLMSYCNTPLHTYLADEAIMEAMAFVKMVYAQGKTIDFKKQDVEGKTPLLLAAKIRKPDCVRELLRYGAGDSLLIPDNDGRNVLHIMCILGDMDGVKILMEHDRDNFFMLMDMRDNEGNTPYSLLDMSSVKTRNVLDSIFINPDRDWHAPNNRAPLGSYTPAHRSFLETVMDGRSAVRAYLDVLNTSELKK